MTPVIHLAMFGFILAMLVVWALLPARRALVVTYVVAWLFLPGLAEYKIAQGIPAYSKLSAGSFLCLLGAIIFRSGPLTQIRWSLWDVPMALFVTCNMLTHSFGGNGPYEGLTSSFTQFLTWGVPWIMARAYVKTLDDFRDVAVSLVVAGLVYMPLTWIEMRFSPQLHYWVYGSYQHDFSQTKRMEGWRPMVFMQHGLAVGLLMALTALAAAWLAWNKAMPRILGIPPLFLAVLLMATAILCRSALSSMILVAGLGALVVAKTFKVKWVVLALVLIAPTYVTLRLAGDLALDPAISVARSVFGKDRSQSLEFRLKNESALVERALQQPVFGWGGGNKYLVKSREPGNDNWVVPDQFWAIVLGQNGIWGLTMLLGAMVLPSVVFFWKCPARDLGLPEIAPMAVLALIPALFMIDCLMNAMMNPLWTIAGASTVSALVAAKKGTIQGVGPATSSDAAQSLLVAG